MPARADFRFFRRLRLRRRGEFQRLFDEGKHAGDHRLQVWAAPNELEYSRFGLIVGRKHGGAVQRNRIKRVLREAFRLSLAQLPRGLDIVCAPRVGAQIRLQKTIESLVRITERLARSSARIDRRRLVRQVGERDGKTGAAAERRAQSCRTSAEDGVAGS